MSLEERRPGHAYDPEVGILYTHNLSKSKTISMTMEHQELAAYLRAAIAGYEQLKKQATLDFDAGKEPEWVTLRSAEKLMKYLKTAEALMQSGRPK